MRRQALLVVAPLARALLLGPLAGARQAAGNTWAGTWSTNYGGMVPAGVGEVDPAFAGCIGFFHPFTPLYSRPPCHSRNQIPAS